MTDLPKFKKPQAILFDLDGTLADSAPDLTAAINNVRVEFNLEKCLMKTYGHMLQREHQDWSGLHSRLNATISFSPI